MNERRKTEISRFLSLILRHRPETVGIRLDANGWADVDDLLLACAGHDCGFTREELREVVADSDKRRFSFDADEKRIRANQGHSLEVDLELEEKTPPPVLYHGTAGRNTERIFGEGLKKMSRHHVHLSAAPETARAVGARYGRPVVLKVDAAGMSAAGHRFYVSANGVWLTEAVPPRFLETDEEE